LHGRIAVIRACREQAHFVARRADGFEGDNFGQFFWSLGVYGFMSLGVYMFMSLYVYEFMGLWVYKFKSLGFSFVLFKKRCALFG
jgi:hypothetical protein